jgi:hypothetical protein
MEYGRIPLNYAEFRETIPFGIPWNLSLIPTAIRKYGSKFSGGIPNRRNTVGCLSKYVRKGKRNKENVKVKEK